MKFKIRYRNSGITQEMEMIPHSTYLNIIKPTKDQIHLLESKLNNHKLKLTKDEREIVKTEIITLQNIIKSHPSNFCTSESPIGKAVRSMYYNTGRLELPENQGGTQWILIEML